DPRAFPRSGTDVELVHQSLRAPEPEAEPVARGEAVLQRLLDVRDPRALVLEDEPEAALGSVVQALEQHDAAAAVLHHLARDLARGGDDLRLVDEVEPEPDGPLADRLPHPDDVLGAAHETSLMPDDGHCYLAPSTRRR